MSEQDSKLTTGQEDHIYWLVVSIVAVGAAWIFGEIGWVNHSPEGAVALGGLAGGAILSFGYAYNRLEESA